MRPTLIPMITAVIRLVAPSLRMALPRWNSTVFSETDRISAISQFVLPSLHHFRHSTSFDVRRPAETSLQGELPWSRRMASPALWSRAEIFVPPIWKLRPRMKCPTRIQLISRPEIGLLRRNAQNRSFPETTGNLQNNSIHVGQAKAGLRPKGEVCPNLPGLGGSLRGSRGRECREAAPRCRLPFFTRVILRSIEFAPATR